MPWPGFAKQSAVLGQQMRRGRTVCSLQLATGAGAMPWPGFAKQSAVLGQQMRRGRMKDAVVLADLHLALPFPQVALVKGANLPKPVHTPRPRPTRAPSSDAQVQKTGRFTSPSPISAGHSPPKTQICRFFVPSPPKTSTNGAECARHLMGCS